MIGSTRCLAMLTATPLAVAVLISAGCANTPRGAAPPSPASAAIAGTAATAPHSRGPQAPAAAPAYAGDETPASQTQLVESADFALNAERQGFKPEVRNGVVIYCWTDDDIGSRIPSKKCVNQAQLELMLQQRQKQRDALQHGSASGCTPGLNCN
jgi:hypothetical protein